MEQPIGAMQDELPPEIEALFSEAGLSQTFGGPQPTEEATARLQSLSVSIAKKRNEAIEARNASMIETEWTEDEEAYQGIDDANRSESVSIKPTTSAGGLTTRAKSSDTRSTVFLNITRPYVDSSAARMADMLLPTDDRNWQIKPTPVPDLINALPTPITDAQGNPVMRPATEADMEQSGQAMPSQTPTDEPAPEAPPVQLTVKDLADKAIKEASDAAEAAQKRIDDWLVECQYHGEVRKVIEDCARVGVGILKGPYPSKHRSTSVEKGKDGYSIKMKMDIAPASRRIDPWKLFPDGACGENIHNGSHLFELDHLTRRKVKDLKGLPGYIDAQIDAALEEGPQRGRGDLGNPSRPDTERSEKDQFEIWYFYGEVDRDDLIAAGADLQGEDPDHDSFYAIITMVNDRVIKAAINPLESGEFPYDVMVWQRRAGHWAGIGVSRHIRTPQRMINAGSRNMLDNAGLGGGPIFGVRRGAITPSDGNWNITPRKVFFLNEGSDVEDIRKAITVLIIPIVTDELMKIIEFALKMAEDVTGLPMLMQGQQGNSAPDTYGGQILVTNNASTVLRRIARTFDDRITEPHIRRYYQWLLIYGPEESEKGDFTIDARGSAALVEREIQAQEINQIMGFSLNPAFGINPKNAMSEYLRGRRFDPLKYQYTEAEQEQMSKQPPPVAPAVQAAQIRAQSAVQVVQAKGQEELKQISAEAEKEQQMLQAGQATPHMATATARIEQAKIHAISAENIEASRANAEAARAEKEFEIARQNGEFRIGELQLKERIALLEYANREKISLDNVKAQLAKSAMDNQTKKQLAAAEIQLALSEGDKNRGLDLHKHTSLIRDEISTPVTP